MKKKAKENFESNLGTDHLTWRGGGGGVGGGGYVFLFRSEICFGQHKS